MHLGPNFVFHFQWLLTYSLEFLCLARRANPHYLIPPGYVVCIFDVDFPYPQRPLHPSFRVISLPIERNRFSTTTYSDLLSDVDLSHLPVKVRFPTLRFFV